MYRVSGYLSGRAAPTFLGAISRWIQQSFADDVVEVFAKGASGYQNSR